MKSLHDYWYFFPITYIYVYISNLIETILCKGITVVCDQGPQTNLATQLDYENSPGLKEPVPNKYLSQTPCNQLYTTCYDDAEESFQTMRDVVRNEDTLQAVLMVQRAWRMKVWTEISLSKRLKSLLLFTFFI